jgi:hypothetical protein
MEFRIFEARLGLFTPERSWTQSAQVGFEPRFPLEKLWPKDSAQKTLPKKLCPKNSAQKTLPKKLCPKDSGQQAALAVRLQLQQLGHPGKRRARGVCDLYRGAERANFDYSSTWPVSESPPNGP